MDDISAAGATYDQTTSLNKGFYISMPGTGEKILADSALFGGVVYFTSYAPTSGSNPCAQSGNAYLYAVRYTSGAGAFSGGVRSMSVGVGIASSPVISLKPPGSGSNVPDLYVTTSTGGAGGSNTQRVNFNPPGMSNMVNILNWKDRRIQ
jgi:Tfp pilus tip-associated adhesin PilY1